MNLRKVVLPERVAQQLAGLPVEVRHNVETFLENLDVLLGTSRPASISQHFERMEDGGLVVHVERATVFFSVSIGVGTALIRQIELHSSSARSTRGRPSRDE